MCSSSHDYLPLSLLVCPTLQSTTIIFRQTITFQQSTPHLSSNPLCASISTRKKCPSHSAVNEESNQTIILQCWVKQLIPSLSQPIHSIEYLVTGEIDRLSYDFIIRLFDDRCFGVFFAFVIHGLGCFLPWNLLFHSYEVSQLSFSITIR